MSGAQQVEETNDDEPSELTKTEFFERIKLEGVTLQGDFYMPHGEGRGRRYYKYDPAAVNGFDAVRGDGGEIEAQQVASHDTARTEQVPKDHVEDVVFPKVRDGFGAFGLVEVESARDEDTQSGGPDGAEPMDDEEVAETIRQNHGERGFFAEDDNGEQKVVSLAHPDAELVGYITGSHVKALPADGLTSVDDYRAAVIEAVGGEAGITKPDNVPIATDDMMDTFEQAGNSISDEQRDKITRQVEARWEDGEYDHLRKGDEDGGGS